jgi:hypothetical protein
MWNVSWDTCDNFEEHILTYYGELCAHSSYTGGIVTDFGMGDRESIYGWDLKYFSSSLSSDQLWDTTRHIFNGYQG